ncbi:MAG: DUF2550 domain-containing protein [Corynebacterium sp.]|uniref:DUF2550 domain-containing protein n=1 Tax=Corynebacterium sp. TaxID=1720 RepID=UPI0026DDAF89|nr:DUF2550 domain-containing protein [Corynebacterium sp.]MDO4760552.1 DUF2550 domain-containing protein [Corynebacterium sp.]
MSSIIPQILMWLLLLVFFAAGALAAWRFFTLRSSGTSAIIRRLPATGNHGWRHGLVRYEGKELKFYQLRSLSPFPDGVFNRFSVELTGQRESTREEASFLPFNEPVFEFTHDAVAYEAQMSAHGRMAFVAWIESAPDARTDKMSPRELRRRMRNKH